MFLSVLSSFSPILSSYKPNQLLKALVWLKTAPKNISLLRVVHKLHLQDKVGRWSLNVHFFVNVHTIENANASGVGGQQKPKSCQRSLSTTPYSESLHTQ